MICFLFLDIANLPLRVHSQALKAGFGFVDLLKRVVYDALGGTIVIDEWKSVLGSTRRGECLLLFLYVGTQLLHVRLQLGDLLWLAVHLLSTNCVVHDLQDLLYLAQVVSQ